MKNAFVILLALLTFATVAQEDEKAPSPPLDPDYEGTHGMVMVNNNATLYVSHLPLYNKPHDAQIIYKVSVAEPHVRYLVRDADLVTIKPEPFNLQRMMRGEVFSITADVYTGHFERGGMKTYESVTVNLNEQLYFRALKDLPPSNNTQEYDSIPLGSNKRMLVHKIQSRPSYDHLVLFHENVNCVTTLHTSSAVPRQGEILNRLTFCGSMKPLYYETRDFQ